MSQISYNVDIVMCIDATSSMRPYIDEVKDNALQFDERLRKTLAEKEKRIDNLRVRIVVFRDIKNDGLDNALLESDFMALPDEQDKFKQFIDLIHAEGGGELPENSLEALAAGMNSNWTRDGDKQRHLIVMFTDAPAHPLGKTGSTELPDNIPTSFEGFVDMWEGQVMDDRSKRMLIFAPDEDPWRIVAETCEGVFWIESKAGKGLSDIHYEEIFKGIVNSV